MHNSIRLGIFQRLLQLGWMNDENGEFSKFRCAAAAGLCGFIGISFSYPFYMVKTQIQARSDPRFAVGYQHNHKGLVDALKKTYKSNGIKGFYKGYSAMIPRDFLSSSIQLTSFSTCKDFSKNHKFLAESIFFTTLLSSGIAAMATCIFMTPFDTVATRMLNQPLNVEGKGLFYKNLIDCFILTSKAEGIWNGLYKGFGANFFRMAPQHMINLTLWEHFKKWKKDYESQ